MTAKRVATTIVAIDALAILGCFLVAVVRVSADRVVPSLAFRWELAEALLRAFALLPTLQFLAIAVTLGSSEGSTEELVLSSIFPAALVSAVLAAATLAAAPALSAQRSAIEETTTSFNESLGRARSALSAGQIAAAQIAIGRCESVSPKDERVLDLAEKISIAALKAKTEAGLPPEAAESPKSADPEVAKDYYLKALEFADKGDDFSAHWYAATAAKLDPSFEDARRLAATSWEKLSTAGADPADQERSAYYERKLLGYSMLRSGDPVGAYRVFKELSAAHTTDPDVARYLTESLAATEKAAFFRDESDAAFATGMVGDFLIRISGPEEGDRLLAAESVALSGESLYLRDVEYLELGAGGRSVLARAPYGKLFAGELRLLCVERDRPATTYRPRWEGAPAGNPTSVAALKLDARTAYRLALARSAPSALSLLEIWKTAGEARSFGVDPSPAIRDILDRTAFPFALFTASALGALVGARFRRKGESFPKALYALVPVMAAAAAPLFVMIGRIDSLISAWAARAFAGLGAVGAAAGIRAGILILSIVLIAGSRSASDRAAEAGAGR